MSQIQSLHKEKADPKSELSWSQIIYLDIDITVGLIGIYYFHMSLIVDSSLSFVMYYFVKGRLKLYY